MPLLQSLGGQIARTRSSKAKEALYVFGRASTDRIVDGHPVRSAFRSPGGRARSGRGSCHGVLGADTRDELRRQDCGASARPRRTPPFSDKALELVDGDGLRPRLARSERCAFYSHSMSLFRPAFSLGVCHGRQPELLLIASKKTEPSTTTAAIRLTTTTVRFTGHVLLAE